MNRLLLWLLKLITEAAPRPVEIRLPVEERRLWDKRRK